MSKVFTADEVKKHTTRSSVWLVIRNDVYDVTSFVGEHPGGEDPLLEAAGQDATIAFDDVGHSSDARSMLKKYKIGSLAPGQGCCKMKPKVWRPSDLLQTGPSNASINLQSDEKPWLKYTSPVRSRRRAPPPESSKLKWALLALGLAIIIGIAYKKYAT